MEWLADKANIGRLQVAVQPASVMHDFDTQQCGVECSCHLYCHVLAPFVKLMRQLCSLKL